ncbi:hypothetical protein O9929_19690 [Vibrio lentus]|nr:hypothetical protein [Vibrio lentus]
MLLLSSVLSGCGNFTEISLMEMDAIDSITDQYHHLESTSLQTQPWLLNKLKTSTKAKLMATAA